MLVYPCDDYGAFIPGYFPFSICGVCMLPWDLSCLVSPSLLDPITWPVSSVPGGAVTCGLWVMEAPFLPGGSKCCSQAWDQAPPLSGCALLPPWDKGLKVSDAPASTNHPSGWTQILSRSFHLSSLSLDPTDIILTLFIGPLLLFWLLFFSLYYELICLEFFRNFSNFWPMEGTKFYFLVLFSITFFLIIYRNWRRERGFSIFSVCGPDLISSWSVVKPISPMEMKSISISTK